MGRLLIQTRKEGYPDTDIIDQETGARISGVTSLSIYLNSSGESRCTLEISNVDLDLLLEEKNVEVIPYKEFVPYVIPNNGRPILP